MRTIQLINGKRYERIVFAHSNNAHSFAWRYRGWVAGTYNTGTIVYIPARKGA